MAPVNQRDDGYIELVLRVLAHMCDGQHRGLQVRTVSSSSSSSYESHSCVHLVCTTCSETVVINSDQVA